MCRILRRFRRIPLGRGLFAHGLQNWMSLAHQQLRLLCSQSQWSFLSNAMWWMTALPFSNGRYLGWFSWWCGAPSGVTMFKLSFLTALWFLRSGWGSPLAAQRHLDPISRSGKWKPSYTGRLHWRAMTGSVRATRFLTPRCSSSKEIFWLWNLWRTGLAWGESICRPMHLALLSGLCCLDWGHRRKWTLNGRRLRRLSFCLMDSNNTSQAILRETFWLQWQQCWDSQEISVPT